MMFVDKNRVGFIYIFLLLIALIELAPLEANMNLLFFSDQRFLPFQNIIFYMVAFNINFIKLIIYVSFELYLNVQGNVQRYSTV